MDSNQEPQSNNDLESKPIETFDPDKHFNDGVRLVNKDTHMWHLNLNLLACVDIITTGNNPRRDDIIEISILALNSHYTPHKGIIPFTQYLQPRRPENIDLEKLPKRCTQPKLFQSKTKGTEAYIAADRLELWIQRINLKWGKKIIPLCHNWVDKRPFLMDWLGVEHFYSYFGDDYRDPIPSSLFMNDRADIHTNRIPYPKQTWAFLASEMGIDKVRVPDTLEHCIALGEIYKRMLKRK